MKKLFTLVFLLSSTIMKIDAQSQRLVLVEEFSGENCGPCAAVNPYVTDVVSSHPNEVLLLKYQVNIPSAGPLYNQNKADVNSRKSLYGVNSAPWMEQDGNGDWDNDPNTDEHPGYWVDDESYLLNRYAVPSPFTIAITHSFSDDADSFYATAVITASQAFNVSVAGKLKFQFAMAEELITFATAPGSNGETEFHNVMRKMYPSAAGTVMQDAFTNGQSITYNFSGPIPSYIYDKSQIKFIGFIQDENTKEVHQSAASIRSAVNNDGQSYALEVTKYLNCSSDVTPAYTLKNNGANPLTSCTIQISLDNVVVDSIVWTGNIAPGSSSNLTVPAIPSLEGSHTLTFSVKNPNGTTDLNKANDVIKSNFMIASTAVSAPLAEGFEGTTTLPTGWGIENGGSTVTWAKVSGGSGGSSKSYKMDYYNSPNGDVDNLYLSSVDATSGNRLKVSFDRNAVQYVSTSFTALDSLSLDVSFDCGASWNTSWFKSGADLATNGSSSNAYSTPVATAWANDSAMVTVPSNATIAHFRFRANSDFGNNLYLDNINITSYSVSTGIENEKELASVRIFPNPATDKVNVSFTNINSGNVKVTVVNTLGEVVAVLKDETMNAGEHQINWNSANAANGIYTVKIESNGNNVTRKVVVAK